MKRKTPELAEEITNKGTGTTENKEPSTSSEGSHILKLKKEAFAGRRALEGDVGCPRRDASLAQG